jgi:PAS domain S-box-containing protein
MLRSNSSFGLFTLTILRGESLESNQLESSFRHNNHVLKELLQEIPSALWVLSNNNAGRFLFVNKQAIELTGYSQEDAPTFSEWCEKIFPDEEKRHCFSEDWHLRLEEQFQKKQNYYEVTRKDGSVAHIQFRAKPIEDIVLISGQDLSPLMAKEAKLAQKIADEEMFKRVLQESEEKCRSLYEFSPVGIALNRFSDGVFISANRPLYEMVGYTEEEFYRLSYWEITPQEYAQQESIVLEQLKRKGQYGPYFKEYIHKNGSRIPILLNGATITDRHGEKLIWSIIIDITELTSVRNALEVQKDQLQALTNQIPTAIATFDRDMRYLNCTKKWLEDFDIDHDPVGESHYDLFPDCQSFWKIIHERCLRGEVVGSADYPSKSIGKKKAFKWEAAPWRFADGSVGGSIVSTMDISVLLDRESQLEKARQEADRANGAKGQFIASLSHEIRTPMTAIITMAELLKESGLNDEQQKYVGVFRSAAETLLELINDILDFSKMESGHLNLNYIPMDLKLLVEEVFDIMSFNAKKKDITIKSHIDPFIPRFIKGDPVRLRQILMNLLSNSLKFTEYGEVSLDVRALNDRLHFSVSDTGIGISQNQQDLIFSPFVQGDDSITRRFGGSGLGLAICKKLLSQMGGEISVTSEVGSGSTFYFNIPLIQLEASQGCAKVSVHPEMLIKAAKSSPKILIVEDSELNQKLIKALLSHLPLDLDFASNGQEGLDKFATHAFDLIFMDIQMPIMDGYTATRQIRELENRKGQKKTPIVALTAHVFQEDILQCELAGCSDHLGKPFKKDHLIAMISKFLH